MKITLTDQERRMLLESAISFKQADKDSLEMDFRGAGGPINKDLLKVWNVIIKKLRKPVRHA